MVSSESILPLVLFFTKLFEMVYFTAVLQRRQHQHQIAVYMIIINALMTLFFKKLLTIPHQYIKT